MMWYNLDFNLLYFFSVLTVFIFIFWADKKGVLSMMHAAVTKRPVLQREMLSRSILAPPQKEKGFYKRFPFIL